MDSLREDITVALGHACVPFSTKEELEEGLDELVLFFLEGASAYIKAKKSTESAGVLLNDIFMAMKENNLFETLSARLMDTVSMIEVYKVGTPDQKRQILPHLKKRNIL